MSMIWCSWHFKMFTPIVSCGMGKKLKAIRTKSRGGRDVLKFSLWFQHQLTITTQIQWSPFAITSTPKALICIAIYTSNTLFLISNINSDFQVHYLLSIQRWCPSSHLPSPWNKAHLEPMDLAKHNSLQNVVIHSMNIYWGFTIHLVFSLLKRQSNKQCRHKNVLLGVTVSSRIQHGKA